MCSIKYPNYNVISIPQCYMIHHINSAASAGLPLHFFISQLFLFYISILVGAPALCAGCGVLHTIVPLMPSHASMHEVTYAIVYI